MPKVRMTASLVGEHGQDWLSGETYDATPHYARYLVGRGAAVLVDGELPATPLTTQAFEASDPVAAHRDPVKRKKK